MNALLLAIIAALPPLSHAHPLEIGVIEWREEKGKFLVSLQLNPVDVARFSKIPIPPPVDWLESRAPRIFFSTLGAAMPHSESGICRWASPKVRTEIGKDGDHVSISAIAVCPSVKGVSLALPFLERGSSAFRVIGGNFVATKAHPEIQLASAPGIFDFVILGMEHIGVGKGQWFRDGKARFPEGIDHILFVLALTLGAGSALSLVKSISGFTLGHSLTLFLASMNLVALPTRMVEMGIAFSIFATALLVVWGKRECGGWRIAAAFGMLHGLGFASALQHFQLTPGHLLLAVFGFNLGVELAQLLIVLLATVPLVAIRSQSKRAHSATLRFAAAGIAISGCYWLIERAIA